MIGDPDIATADMIVPLGQRFKYEQVSTRAALKAEEDGNPLKVLDLDDDDLLLLPRRVVAYAFRERRFVMLDILSLKEIETSTNVFEDLKINERHKRLVTSLGKSHLDKKAVQKLRPSVSLNQDLIRGKGSGLVILLHGVPGVGKTATAEAVEDSLKDIFRLAHLWDCVLLLDEADISLSRRELGDLKRNALVSVFLRVLEYYSGILFLTTNRVGTLDEAFKSRIHVSLHYPPLNKHQTLEIFKVNIRKLREIVKEKQKLQDQLESNTTKQHKITIDAQSILHYAKWHFDVNEETPEQRWNGRQIRNAFQIAYSLAQFDLNGAAPDQGNWADERSTTTAGCLRTGDGRLDYRQFETVADAVAEFENYLTQATNGTDADRARKDFTRDDYFDSRRQSQRPAYNPPVYQRQLLPSSQAERPRYRPPPARRGEQPTPTRKQYRPRPTTQQAHDGRPQQRPANVMSSGPIRNSPVPRKHPNARAGMARAGPGQQEQQQQQQQQSRTTNARNPIPRPARLAGAKCSDSGYSGWSSATARSPGPDLLGASQDWQLDEQDVAVDGEYQDQDDGSYEDRDERYGGSGQYEGDGDRYGPRGEDQPVYDDLDGIDGEDGQYLDDDEDQERWPK
ncbi:P-loop containing nucleoside triphosphate hydrolase protein [Chaetomium strumarium]|uniref:P-loop containing nucleoside triphosphate hydrolase protein n=1 Tax=Chaetomium strumarium TaxID=1170767 RepID=A0AAJ0M288_9PEZI|nr:P-loop containing nucleoside triphosphate hydrolase protein [Chaetomium strumarium]